MTRTKIAAQALTVLVIAALLCFFAYRQRAVARPPGLEKEGVENETGAPESVIWRMVDAAREASVESYLDCYSGEMEQALRQNLREMGATKFRQYLADLHRQVKGIAVSPPLRIAAGEARVQVEYVHQDRNEAQQFYVRRIDGKWRIFRVDASERQRTLVPYGAPVQDQD